MKVLIYVLSWGMHLPLFWEQFHNKPCQPPDKCYFINCHLKALVFLYAFEESVDWHLLSSFCHDSNLHISLFKYELSTMGVSKESISKFLIGNWFHVILRILCPYSNRRITCHAKLWLGCLQEPDGEENGATVVANLGRPGWAMAPSDFWLTPCLDPQFFS